MGDSTALHAAVMKGDAGAVFDAIRDGADVNALDGDGRPPAWYGLGDPQHTSEEELEQRSAIMTMLRLHGADLEEPVLAGHLLRVSREIELLVYGVDTSGHVAPEPTLGDLGETWRCDIVRQGAGVRAWLVDHPHVQVVEADVDLAVEELFVRIADDFGDCEPNLEFVGVQPEEL